MKIAVIDSIKQGGLLRRIFHKKQTPAPQNVLEVQIPGIKNITHPAWVENLKNKTYYNLDKHAKCRSYTDEALAVLSLLDSKSHEKAVDLAQRLNEKSDNPLYMPKNWNYLLYIYNDDYDFVKSVYTEVAPSKIEAMHHVKEEAPKEDFLAYSRLVPEMINKLLYLRKEYPKQVNEILHDKDYLNLFDYRGDKVPENGEIENFFEFIKSDSDIMKQTLEIFKNSNRACDSNIGNCEISDAVKYAKMVKGNPETAVAILKAFPAASPEFIELMLKHSDGDANEVIENYRLYDRFVHPLNISRKKDIYDVDWDNVIGTLAYPISFSKEDLKDFDEFLGSKFIPRLKKLIAEKDEEYKVKRETNFDYECTGFFLYANDIRDFFKNKTDWSLDSQVNENNKMLREILQNDREFFLRLVKDDVMIYSHHSNLDKVLQFYKDFPDVEMTGEWLTRLIYNF